MNKSHSYEFCLDAIKLCAKSRQELCPFWRTDTDYLIWGKENFPPEKICRDVGSLCYHKSLLCLRGPYESCIKVAIYCRKILNNCGKLSEKVVFFNKVFISERCYNTIHDCSLARNICMKAKDHSQ